MLSKSVYNQLAVHATARRTLDRALNDRDLVTIYDYTIPGGRGMKKVTVASLRTGLGVSPVTQTYGAITGTVSRAAYAVRTAATSSVGYVQAEAQAVEDALAGASARLAALITDLRASGLIK